MSKGGLLCVLVLLQAVRLRLLAGQHRLFAGQIGDEFLCQDPIWRPSVMLSHVSDVKLDSTTGAARIFAREVLDDEARAGDGYGANHAVVPDNFVAGGDLDVDDDDEEEDESLWGSRLDDDDGGEAKDSSEEHTRGEVQCPECGKFFKNDKSMFGHLRSHPNRGYKGATPPVKKPPSSRSDESPASLPQPPVDDHPMARYGHQRDPRLSAYEILAAYVMLTLRYRDDQAARQTPPPSPPPCSKRKHESAELDEAGIEGSVTRKAEAEGATVLRSDDHGGAIGEVPRKRGRKKSKEGREAHRKEKDVASTKEKRPYICKHCQAAFPTHQALGGHMAAHNKDRRVQAQNEQQSAGEAYQGKVDHGLNVQEAKAGEECRRSGMSLSSREQLMEHYSSIFNKGCHSGQEPGGYMSQQFERKDDGSPPVATPTAGGDGRRLIDIDLNVEAPEQE